MSVRARAACHPKRGQSTAAAAVLAVAAVILAAGASSLPFAASEPLFLTQALEFRYDRWQQTYADTNTSGIADYNFMLQAPVATYRLGSLTVTGTLEYDRQTAGHRSSSSAGLNRYGFHLFLFPYRRFHLSLDYIHSQSPSYFGGERVKGDLYGLEYSLRNRRWPNLTFTLRRGETWDSTSNETWTQGTLTGNQTIGSTFYNFSVNDQEMKFSNVGSTWSVLTATGSTDTLLKNRWRLRTNLNFTDNAGDWSLGLSGTAWGDWRGWTSVTDMEIGALKGVVASGESLGISQSLAKTLNRYTIYGSASVIGLTGSAYDTGGSGSSNSAVSLQAGGMVQVGGGWSVVADASLQRAMHEVQVAGVMSPNVTTLHAGIVHGGDLPSILRSSLFFVSDLSFNSHLRSDYPPGYVPAELANQIMQRRVQQQGLITFAADYYDSQRAGGGKQDWARMTGSLQAGRHFSMLVIGDWIRDNAFTQCGHRPPAELHSANMVFSFSHASISASGGYFKETLSGPLAPPPGLLNDRPTTFYTVGFNSYVWKMAYGLYASRYDQGDGNPLTTYSLYDTINFRRISFKLIYEWTERKDGYKTSHLSLDLLRVFDTMAFFAPRGRY